MITNSTHRAKKLISIITSTAILFLVVVGLAAKPAAAQTKSKVDPANAEIRYTLDLSDAKNHYLTVTATLPASGSKTELMMAVWTPGSYLVREYARHIDTMSVYVMSENQPAAKKTKLKSGKQKTKQDKHANESLVEPVRRELVYSKVRKNRWEVDTTGVKQFVVSYRLYCNEMSVRTNKLNSQYAVLNGAPTFITIPEKLGQPHAVELKLPSNWKRSATSLAAGKTAHSFVAETYDEIVDSPIVAGNINVYPFEAAGITHQLVNVGESGYWDGTKAASDLKKIVEQHQEMWDVIPYDRYLFLNVIAESGGGLEHDFSTLLMTSRWNFRDEKKYKDWLSLASHEFFHTWNVRRLRPTTLVEYDYENEVYTESLWIAEGITSYYEDLALVRADLITQTEYLERISGNIERTQQTDGRKIQSLKDSSFDTWIKFYRPDENSPNTRTSYYAKGAVVAFLLDARIRSETGGKKSLDDVLRKMFKKYSKSGYRPADFRKVSSDIAGVNLDEWFRSTVDSTNELDFQDIVALGIQLPGITTMESAETDDEPEGAGKNKKASSEKRNDAEAASKQADTDSKNSDSKKSKKLAEADDSSSSTTQPTPKKKTAWLGVRTTSTGGLIKVAGIQTDSPATKSGLNTGDEIIAIDGFRVTGSLDGHLKQFSVGDEIELLISRSGQLMNVAVVIGERSPQKWKLKMVAKPTDAQQALRDDWLGSSKAGKK